MAHKAAFPTEKCLAKSQKRLLLACLIFTCCMSFGCPIDRSIKDSLGQENFIVLKNYCGYPVFISVNGFTPEIYTGRDGGILNSAKKQEILPSHFSVYSWSRKAISAPTPRFDVQNDFSIIASVEGQPDRIYGRAQLIDNSSYKDDFYTQLFLKNFQGMIGQFYSAQAAKGRHSALSIDFILVSTDAGARFLHQAIR